MNRPVYETSDHLAAENFIAVLFAKKYRVTLIKLPRCLSLDYVLSDPSEKPLLGFLEIKDRQSYSIKSIPDLMVSEKKYMNGATQAQLHNVPFYLCVRMKEGIFVHRWNDKERLEVKRSGRTINKRDDYDIERCVHIPWKLFTPLFSEKELSGKRSPL